MLTNEDKKILASVLTRQEQECPYCKLPLYLSDTSVPADDGTLVDIWECFRDNRTFTVPAGCSVGVLKKLHVTVKFKTVGCYGLNELGEQCNSFTLINYTTYCQLCSKEIDGGWKLGGMQVCAKHVHVTYEMR